MEEMRLNSSQNVKNSAIEKEKLVPAANPFPYKYLSEDEMELMLQMARRRLRKDKEVDEWLQYVRQIKLQDSNQFPQKKEPLNNSPNLRRIQQTMDNQTKMLSGLIGQVQNLTKSAHKTPVIVKNAASSTSKPNNVVTEKQMKSSNKMSVLQYKNTKSVLKSNKAPHFMGMTVSQQQKTKPTQPSCANFPHTTQKCAKKVFNSPTLLKDGRRTLSPSEFFQTGEMLKRINEMEAEVQEIHDRWTKTSNAVLESIVTSPAVNEEMPRRTRLAAISSEDMESIIGNLENFSRRVNSSKSPLSRFASTKPVEIVADRIVDDIITAVTLEINKVAEDVISELIDAEFVQLTI